MKTFIQFLENSEETSTMSRMAMYNNIVLRKSAVGKDRLILKRINEFLINILRYVNTLVNSNIDFNIYANKISNGDTVLSIEVENRNKRVDLILNKDVFNEIFKDHEMIDVSDTNIFKIKNDIPSIKKAIGAITTYLDNSFKK